MKKKTARSKKTSGEPVRATNVLRTTTAPSAPSAKRDNVLGRRPSKADPLGEQPGTIPAEQGTPPKAEKDPDLRRPEDQVTNADVSDRPVGGM